MQDLSKAKPLFAAYGECFLDWNLGGSYGSHPTNPVRAKLAIEKLIERLGASIEVHDPAVDADIKADKAELAKVHDESYIHAVVENYVDAQWGHEPSRPVAMAGLAMFRATVRAVRALLHGEARVAFNPQGAKHHAQRDHSSGFCVFNDMAWAALEFKDAGLRPLYLDWDIHAGDGVYELLRKTDIPTLSIHNGAIYPGNSKMQDMARSRAGERYALHQVDEHAYNWNVATTDGDEAFKWAIDEAAEVIDGYAPNVILLAAGADGHEGSNNLGLQNRYSYAGFEYAADAVAALAEKHNARVLIGGAGGYQPLDHTPEIWARVVARIYNRVSA
jgi:acetoin utilization protein AcuC